MRRILLLELSIFTLLLGMLIVFWRAQRRAAKECASLRRDLWKAAQDEHDLSGEIERMRKTEREALITLGIVQVSPERP